MVVAPSTRINGIEQFEPLENDIIVKSEILIEKQREHIKDLREELQTTQQRSLKKIEKVTGECARLMDGNSALRVEIDLLKGEIEVFSERSQTYAVTRSSLEKQIESLQIQLSKAVEQSKRLEVELANSKKAYESMQQRDLNNASGLATGGISHDERGASDRLRLLQTEILSAEKLLQGLTMQNQRARIDAAVMNDCEYELLEAQELIKQQKRQISELQKHVDSLSRERYLLPPMLIVEKGIRDNTASPYKDYAQAGKANYQPGTTVPTGYVAIGDGSNYSSSGLQLEKEGSINKKLEELLVAVQMQKSAESNDSGNADMMSFFIGQLNHLMKVIDEKVITQQSSKNALGVDVLHYHSPINGTAIPALRHELLPFYKDRAAVGNTKEDEELYERIHLEFGPQYINLTEDLNHKKVLYRMYEWTTQVVSDQFNLTFVIRHQPFEEPECAEFHLVKARNMDEFMRLAKLFEYSGMIRNVNGVPMEQGLDCQLKIKNNGETRAVMPKAKLFSTDDQNAIALSFLNKDGEHCAFQLAKQGHAMDIDVTDGVCTILLSDSDVENLEKLLSQPLQDTEGDEILIQIAIEKQSDLLALLPAIYTEHWKQKEIISAGQPVGVNNFKELTNSDAPQTRFSPRDGSELIVKNVVLRRPRAAPEKPTNEPHVEVVDHSDRMANTANAKSGTHRTASRTNSKLKDGTNSPAAEHHVEHKVTYIDEAQVIPNMLPTKKSILMDRVPSGKLGTNATISVKAKRSMSASPDEKQLDKRLSKSQTKLDAGSVVEPTPSRPHFIAVVVGDEVLLNHANKPRAAYVIDSDASLCVDEEQHDIIIHGDVWSYYGGCRFRFPIQVDTSEFRKDLTKTKFKYASSTLMMGDDPNYAFSTSDGNITINVNGSQYNFTRNQCEATLGTDKCILVMSINSSPDLTLQFEISTYEQQVRWYCCLALAGVQIKGEEPLMNPEGMKEMYMPIYENFGLAADYIQFPETENITRFLLPDSVNNVKLELNKESCSFCVIQKTQVVAFSYLLDKNRNFAIKLQPTGSKLFAEISDLVQDSGCAVERDKSLLVLLRGRDIFISADVHCWTFGLQISADDNCNLRVPSTLFSAEFGPHNTLVFTPRVFPKKQAVLLGSIYDTIQRYSFSLKYHKTEHKFLSYMVAMSGIGDPLDQTVGIDYMRLRCLLTSHSSLIVMVNDQAINLDALSTTDYKILDGVNKTVASGIIVLNRINKTHVYPGLLPDGIPSRSRLARLLAAVSPKLQRISAFKLGRNGLPFFLLGNDGNRKEEDSPFCRLKATTHQVSRWTDSSPADDDDSSATASGTAGITRQDLVAKSYKSSRSHLSPGQESPVMIKSKASGKSPPPYKTKAKKQQ